MILVFRFELLLQYTHFRLRKSNQMQLVTTLYNSGHTMWGGGAATESKNILLKQQEVGALLDNLRYINPKPDPDGSPDFDVQRSFMLK